MYIVIRGGARRLRHDETVSILDLLFIGDSDLKQRTDIDELRAQMFGLAASKGDSPSNHQFRELVAEVRELTATVHVMMRTLAAANLLDVDTIKAQVAEELAPKPKEKAKRAPRPVEPAVEVTCIKCQVTGMSDTMVKAGADWFCRPCARNP